ncbi:MAG TPA: cation:dicarboxylase symporter family transporter, partial [Bryobacteraceae bacterium]|nr:cation:dicarboxylase symporter family transporter [Bryobacteraceae bacterium]
MKFYRSLYFRVILGIVLGVLLGITYPHTAESMKPLGDGFIKLIRMMIAPIIFFTVVVGIANIGDMKKLGRVGLKALAYFEVVTTAALLIGLTVVKTVQPGAGMNVNPATLDARAVAQYAAQGRELHAVDFLLNIIPSTVTNAFTQGDILQVLLVAILFGLALAAIPGNRPIVEACDKIAHWMFRVVGIIMETAPLGAFGAMAFT